MQSLVGNERDPGRTTRNILRVVMPSMVCLFAIASPLSLRAQTTVEGGAGVTLRFHGDTIWRIRDTTMMRVVLRGDTARRTNFVHGRPTYSATYVAKGDVALLVDHRDGDGRPRPIQDSTRLVPVLIMLGEVTMLENAIRNKATMDRLAQLPSGFPRPSFDAPLSPPTPQRYAMSANVEIVQHLDTIRYIRGCTAAPPVDTTLYLVLLGDSLRRMSPAPRTFGKPMLTAVRADMSSALLRQRAAADPASVADIPRLGKWPCDKR